MEPLAQTAPMTNENQKPFENPPDLIGEVVADDFLVQRRLGQGGMGQVYLAEQKSLNRKVALKILRADLSGESNARKRFEVEARAVAQATHANIVQVYAIGEWNGLHYMALEYVEGWNLRDYITRKGPPDVLLALKILRQVSSALQRASELGITHRDIKPENILLTRKGEVKVADFGLSRDDQQPLNLTQSGITMGTPLYMSPEQVEGKKVDPRSDIYSLGITAYHMLAGSPPFRGATAFEVARQHVQDHPEPLHEVRPDIPSELCDVVSRMIEKDPEDRYQTARELLGELSSIRGKVSGVTGAVAIDAPPTAPSPTRKQTVSTDATIPASAEPAPRKRSRSSLLIIGSVAAALLGGGAIAFVAHRNNKEVGPVAEASERSTPEQREREKRKIAEEYLSGTNGFKNATVGAGVCTELGLLYLDQHRLKEAEAWFRKMEQTGSHLSSPPVDVLLYQSLGLLGLALVESMRDHPVPSNKLFEQAFARATPRRPAVIRNRVPIRQILSTNSELKKWISKAVRRNRANGAKAPRLPAMVFGRLGERDSRP